MAPALSTPVIPSRLPGLPRTGMTPEQQLAALQRVQEQADHRVKLGMQLFKAAEAHTSQYRQVIDQVKAEQARFRGEIKADIARNLEAQSQWAGQLETDLTSAIHDLEAKMERLQTGWSQTQQRIESMMKRSEAMLDQSRTMLAGSTPQAQAPVTGATGSLPAGAAAAPPQPPHRPSVVDAVASTNAADDTPEFYRQILAKLREQDEAAFGTTAPDPGADATGFPDATQP